MTKIKKRHKKRTICVCSYCGYESRHLVKGHKYNGHDVLALKGDNSIIFCPHKSTGCSGHMLVLIGKDKGK